MFSNQTHLSKKNIEIYGDSRRIASFPFCPIQNKNEIKKLIKHIIDKKNCHIILEKKKLYLWYEDNTITLKKYNGTHYKLTKLILADNSFLEGLKKLINYKENTKINIFISFLLLLMSFLIMILVFSIVKNELNFLQPF